MKYDLFDEAKILDNLLLEIAAYDVTGGLFPIVQSEESQRELYVKVAKRFNQFKRGIQLGEYSLESIQADVVSKSGPFFRKSMTEEEAIEELVNPKTSKEDISGKYTQDTILIIEEILKSLKNKDGKNANKLDSDLPPLPPEDKQNAF